MLRPALLALALGVPAASAADVPITFDDAVVAYEAGEHDETRVAFRRMAENGMPEAQFNLGVMLVNGQGGPARPVEGAVWITLAAEARFGPAEDARKIVLDTLDSEQQDEFDIRISDFRRDYSLRSLVDRHAPVACTNDCSGGSGAETGEMVAAGDATDERLIKLEGGTFRTRARSPEYPDDVSSGKMGLVRVGAWVTGDGRLEHPHIVSAWPDDTFVQASLDAIERWQFEPLGEPGDRPADYLGRTFTFRPGDLASSAPEALSKLRNLLEASDDDIEAAHRAVWIIDRIDIPEIEGIRHDAVISTTHRAAQQNIVAAQVDLGLRLMDGDGVERDVAAGTYWLGRAAIEGNTEAQFELSMHDGLGEDYRGDLRRGAARAGYTPAMLAEIRAQVANPEQAEPELLETLIDRLPPRYRVSSDDTLMRARELAGD